MPSGFRRCLRFAGLGCVLACVLAAPATLSAGVEPRVGPIYHRGRSFRIPLNIDPEDRPRIRQIRLWVSSDRGYTWDVHSETSPNQQKPTITFRAPRDGEYWFAVQTVDTSGKLFPEDKDKEVEPNMRVVV